MKKNAIYLNSDLVRRHGKNDVDALLKKLYVPIQKIIAAFYQVTQYVLKFYIIWVLTARNLSRRIVSLVKQINK